MSQQISPTIFRQGQTQLWINGAYLLTSIFWSMKQFYIISCANKSFQAWQQYYLIYYPLITYLRYRKRFLYPRLYRPFFNLKFATDYLGFNKFMNSVWDLDKARYLMRFILAKPKVQLNRWFSLRVMRGVGSNYYKCWQQVMSNTKAFFKTRLSLLKNFQQYRKRLKVRLIDKHAWRSSSQLFLNSSFSHVLSTVARAPIKAFATNMFDYLVRKKLLNYRSHQQHIWGNEYRNSRFHNTLYYDVLNIFLAQAFFINVEGLMLQIVGYSLFRMDRRNVKIKHFLYFVDNIIKHMKVFKQTFKVFRFNTKGKIRGGTARTTAYSAGYGVPITNTIGNILRFSFRHLRSKYGSYGLRIFSHRY